MEHARPPPELSFVGAAGPASRAACWRRWRHQLIVFLKASGVHTEESKVQANLLLNLIGSEGCDIYDTFTFNEDEEREDLDILLKKFDSHFGAKPNITLERYNFFSRDQIDGESIEEYVTVLRLLSKTCEFSVLRDSLVKDRIVCGIREAKVRDRLLRCEDLDLDKTIKICQAGEASKESEMLIAGGSGKGVVHVDSVRGRGKWEYGRGRVRGRGSGIVSRAGPSTSVGMESCGTCGSLRCRTSTGECPARHVTCFVCGKTGHFAKMCKSRAIVSKNVNNEMKHVNEVECNYNRETEDESFYVYTIGCINESNDWFQELVCVQSGLKETFKLDTGADYNILSYNRFVQLGYSDSLLVKKKLPLVSFTSNIIPIKGVCTLRWIYKNVMYNLKFAIADIECSSVLGRDSCEDMNLVKRIKSVEFDSYRDIFEGLGCLPGKYHIVVDKSVTPVVCASRKVPHGLRDRLACELKKMEEMGVIRKVTHPTKWVHPLVLAAKKNNGIRICLDPRELNKAIQRSHFQLPTLSEIASRLHGACYFSVLDANSGFWAVVLDEESADLCTFSTPFGRYQFLRLPFGISCASEVYHGKLRQYLEDLEGVESFVDDIIVWGDSKQVHDRRLKALLERAKEINLKFNKEKCKICVKQVTYLGHVFDAKGLHPDYNKIKAIKEMQTPKDKKDLERFLGAVNYLSKFIRNYSEIAIPLTSLLKKDNEWRWEESEQSAFMRLKDSVCNADVLALYDPAKPVVLSVDASRDALGAVLLQVGRPVEFASRTLTDTQRRYAQIEKEMLAIVFACEHFHQYIYGQVNVLVESDHKPLESIFKKPLNSVPARLQRMLLRVQYYDLKVKYVPGKYMFIADMLSRAPLPDLLGDDIDHNILRHVQMIIENIPISNNKLSLIKKETKNDRQLNLLLKFIKEGWPNNKRDIEEELGYFWSIKDELYVVDNVIFKNEIVLVPKSLRDEMLHIIHEGHLGIDRCKRRARQVMFWPNMGRDIESFVKRCCVCQDNSNAPSREPMLPIEFPNIPWYKVGSDIFEFRRQQFLIIVDYYSNYVEVCKLNNLTSNTVIQCFKEVFSRHGIPKILISDNGTQYTSKQFREFAKSWCFDQVTSSPNYPQANGKSERTVQTVKLILKKSIESGSDFYLALLSFRNTPRDGLSSPAQLLMSRRLRCQLPVSDSLLKPVVVDASEYQTMLYKQRLSKQNYDKHARDLPTLKEGDPVVYVDGKHKNRGTVVSHAATPRSYFIKTNKGGRLRRNRRHLIKCMNECDSIINADVDNDQEQFSDACENVSDDDDEIKHQQQQTNSGRKVDNYSPPLTRLAKKKALQRIAEQF